MSDNAVRGLAPEPKSGLDPTLVTTDSSAPFICLCCKVHVLKYVPLCPACSAPNAVRCLRVPVVSPARSESPETIRARINPALVSTDPSAKYHCVCCGIFVLEYAPTQGYCPACATPHAIRVRRFGSASTETRSSIVTTIERCEGQPLERITTGLLGLDAATGGGFVRRGCYLLSGGEGTGKSTLGLGIVDRLGARALYASSEETRDHVVDRANRIGCGFGVALVCLTDLQQILDNAKGREFLFLDSLHGCDGRADQNARLLLRWARDSGTTVVCIAQLVHSGRVAGGRSIVHNFDATIEVHAHEDDRDEWRGIHVPKNRWGVRGTWGLELGATGWYDGPTGAERIPTPAPPPPTLFLRPPEPLAVTPPDSDEAEPQPPKRRSPTLRLVRPKKSKRK